MTGYDDIINLPHRRPKNRKPLSAEMRAAQFAPFAALTGYEEAVKETARLTDSKRELDEYEKNVINTRLVCILENLEKQPLATITYFVPDSKKKGGQYVTVTDRVIKIKEYERILITEKNCQIPIDDIVSLEEKVFDLSEFDS